MDRLEDIANVVTILGLPLMVLTWLITRERFSKFWNKRRRLILAIAGVVSVMSAAILLWRKGWLAWLQHPVTWPVWGLILYPFVVFGALIGIFLLYLYIDTLRHPTEEAGGTVSWPDYYTLYEARWYFSPSGELYRPPICATCLMEMQSVSKPDRFFGTGTEAWRCRQCDRAIEWNCTTQGDLLEDVTAHFNADVRRRLEQDQ